VVPSPTPAIIPQGFTFNEFVPGDGTGEIHIATTGASKNCLDTLYGTNVADDLITYGLTPGGTCLGAGPMNPGRVEVTQTVNIDGTLGTLTGATCTPSIPNTAVEAPIAACDGDCSHAFSPFPNPPVKLNTSMLLKLI
jgi:hypothetical protein